MFTGRTDVEAETPILWPPHEKSWITEKDPDARKNWGQEEKGMTEDEMVGWHHWLNGHEAGWTLGVGDGQGGPACCGSWGCKESDTTEQLNWTEVNPIILFSRKFGIMPLFFSNTWQILKYVLHKTILEKSAGRKVTHSTVVVPYLWAVQCGQSKQISKQRFMFL